MMCAVHTEESKICLIQTFERRPGDPNETFDVRHAPSDCNVGNDEASSAAADIAARRSKMSTGYVHESKS